MQPGKNPFPDSLLPLGFSSKQTGGHMARSMMLSELQILLGALPLNAGKDAFKAAILSENILGKPTESSRVKSLYHLTELYGLEPSFLIFHTLRRLAEESPTELPLLAMLCTYSRICATVFLINKLPDDETKLGT